MKRFYKSWYIPCQAMTSAPTVTREIQVCSAPTSSFTNLVQPLANRDLCYSLGIMERTISFPQRPSAGHPRCGPRWYILTRVIAVGRLPMYALCHDTSKAGHAHIKSQVAKHGCVDERAS